MNIISKNTEHCWENYNIVISLSKHLSSALLSWIIQLESWNQRLICTNALWLMRIIEKALKIWPILVKAVKYYRFVCALFLEIMSVCLVHFIFKMIHIQWNIDSFFFKKELDFDCPIIVFFHAFPDFLQRDMQEKCLLNALLVNRVFQSHINIPRKQKWHSICLTKKRSIP